MKKPVYTKIAVTEKLYRELKEGSKESGKRLGQFATEYFEDALKKGLIFEMERINLSISAKNFDLEALKRIAGRSNLNVKDYVKKYSEIYPAKNFTPETRE
jgi:hypothetical protein